MTKNTIVLILMLTATSAAGSQSGPIDSTDYNEDVRSGMTVLIDAGTGCHYLTIDNNIVPRYRNTDGDIVCGGLRTEKFLKKYAKQQAQREQSELDKRQFENNNIQQLR